MTKMENITGFVLAGGKSSRMGLDKGLLKINNKTFVQLVTNAMKPLVSDIIIVSNNRDHDKFGYKRIEDIITDSGPLAGIHTALNYSNTDYNLILSCDIPFITTKILRKLTEIDFQNYDVVQIKSQDKTMPLIAIYHKSCRFKCNELLQKGEKRLHVAIDQWNVRTVLIDNKLESFVRNINTKDDLNYAVGY
jgi:molybdopterin-guanine dinucleotide biosynthesis protein A